VCLQLVHCWVPARCAVLPACITSSTTTHDATAGARIKLTRCIELGGGEVDSSKLQAPASFDNAQLSDGLASPGILGKVLLFAMSDALLKSQLNRT
jgi:hypothetical protein